MLKLFALVLAALLPPPAPSAPFAPSAPSATPSPAPSEKPLRTIATVRVTTAFCRKMIETASQSVDVALTDDVRIEGIAQSLRTAELDSSPLAKAKVIADLRKRHENLRLSSAAAERALKQFKADAKTAPTPEQQKALLTFADALDGALTRQRRVADAIGGFIAYLESAQGITEEQLDDIRIDAGIAQANVNQESGWQNLFGLPPSDPSNLPQTLTETARAAAREVDRRIALIDSDENDAAKRIDDAFKNC